MNQVFEQSTSCETWSARYEQLRAGWIEQEIGWGQALFIRQGMAAWMKAWAAAAPAAPEARAVCAAGESAASQPVAMSGELRRQLTRELANLILHRQQEVLA